MSSTCPRLSLSLHGATRYCFSKCRRKKEAYEATSRNLLDPSASSGDRGWDEKVENKDPNKSHSFNATSNPFENPTEKTTFSTNDCIYPESAQRTPSIQAEGAEDANIVSWDDSSYPENPMNWPSWRRWVLINLVSVITLMAGLSSSMLTAGVPALMVKFHSDNQTLASFVVTVFVLGFATGPLWFAPLSELYGRTIVQHTGCIGFVIFSIACALSTSLNMLIGMRLL